MKVLDLHCEHQHVFEGWFAGEDDYDGQRASGLLRCPVCDSAHVEKMLSAPRLNLGRGAELPTTSSTQAGESGVPATSAPPALQAQVLRAMRELMSRAEDVGDRFADEARAMHHGDIEQRSIRGRTSVEEARELIQEGVDILPLPDLPVIKETLQ